MAKLKLPFELEKPSSNEYVTQADQIGYGDKTVKEGLDKINQSLEGGTQFTRYESTAFVNDGIIDEHETPEAFENKKYTDHIDLVGATYIKAVCLKNQYTYAIRIFDANGVQLSQYRDPEDGYMNGTFEISDIPEGASYGVFMADMRPDGWQPYIEVTKYIKSIDEKIEEAASGGDAGVYDISANNSGATYDNLTSALGTNGVNVPANVRNAGMSVKFLQNIYADYKVTKSEGITTEPTGTELVSDPDVNSGTYKASQLTALSTAASLPSSTGADNAATYYLEVSGDTTTYTTWVVEKISSDAIRYVQWRYELSSLTNADFSNVQNWQGVDDEPLINSKNLVTSGSMYYTHLVVEGGNRLEHYGADVFVNSGKVDVHGNVETDALRAHTDHINLENVTYIKCVCYKNQYAPGLRVFNANGTQLQEYKNPATGLRNGLFEISDIPVGASYGIFQADIQPDSDSPYIDITRTVKPILQVLEDMKGGNLSNQTKITYNSTWLAQNSLQGKSINAYGYLEDSTNRNFSLPINIEGVISIEAVAIANAYARWCAFYDKEGHFISTLTSSSGGVKNKLFSITANDIPASAVYIRIEYDNRQDATPPYLQILKNTNNVVNADNTKTAALINKHKHDKALRFAYITDMHYNGSDSSWESDGFTENQKIEYLRDCILNEHRKKPLDFCISTGDSLLIDNKTKAEALQIGMDFREVFIEKVPFPLFASVGNHDNLDEEDWMQVFGHSRQYSFETDTMYFIAIDQMKHSDGTFAYVTHDGGSVQWHNVGIDYDFLDAEIAKANALDKDVVIFFHFFYALRDDDNTAINTFYTYCHNKGVHLVLYGHQHGAECWNSFDNTNAKNTYRDLYGICAGWFAHRDSYPSNSQKWGFFIIEIEDGVMTATNYYVAHNYTSEVAYPLGNVDASQEKKTVNTLQYYPISKAMYQLWKFRN